MTLGKFTKVRRKELMAAVEKRKGILRSQIQSVISGYTTALFVWGPGGLGKSHIITSELDDLCETGWRHHTSYATPKSLILSLMDAPDSIHCYEDCERLYKTDVASSILRAACGSPNGRDRRVTYESANERIDMTFRGGIIVVSNEDISRTSGPLAAVASRFRPVKWDLTLEERVAVIMDMADTGWYRNNRTVYPADCHKVVKFLLDQYSSGSTSACLDIRLYAEHAIPAFVQARDSGLADSWQDILSSKLSGDVAPAESRADKTDRLQEVARLIHEDPKLPSTVARVEEWKRVTGLGQSIYYRHLSNIKRKAKPSDQGGRE